MKKRAEGLSRVEQVCRAGVRLGALMGALVLGVASVEGRQWTSIAGTQIEATCVAKVGGEHWLLEPSGRLIKLTPEKLSPADAKVLEAMPISENGWINSGKVVSLTTRDPGAVETLELLATTKIPVFSVSKVRVEDAFRALTDAMEKQDPKRRRITFRLDPELAERLTSVETRGLTGLRLVGFIFNGDSSVAGTISAGQVEFIVPRRSPVPAERGR